MLNKIKTYVQENPDRVKRIGVVTGAVVGLVAGAALIYLKRGAELPWLEAVETTELASE